MKKCIICWFVMFLLWTSLIFLVFEKSTEFENTLLSMQGLVKGTINEDLNVKAINGDLNVKGSIFAKQYDASIASMGAYADGEFTDFFMTRFNDTDASIILRHGDQSGGNLSEIRVSENNKIITLKYGMTNHS